MEVMFFGLVFLALCYALYNVVVAIAKTVVALFKAAFLLASLVGKLALAASVIWWIFQMWR